MKENLIKMMSYRRQVVGDARYLQQHFDSAADLYIGYLLSLNPEVAALFNHDQSRMRGAFSAMLRVFSSLKFMDDQAYEYERLAQRHKHYGIDYAMVKAANQALILTLKKQCGEQFDHEHLRAWQETLEFFSQLFKQQLSSPVAPAGNIDIRKAG